MAKEKFRPTILGVFLGAKAYIESAEVLKKRRYSVGRTFCDAISYDRFAQEGSPQHLGAETNTLQTQR